MSKLILHKTIYWNLYGAQPGTMRIIGGGDGLWGHPAELGVQNAAKTKNKNNPTHDKSNKVVKKNISTEIYTRRLKQIRYLRWYAECAQWAAADGTFGHASFWKEAEVWREQK